MSRVFVAEELRLKRRVAIKVLSPELAQGLSVERFVREIQTAAALQQANIVPVLAAGDTEGLPFYTMPFVEGESLRARLAREPLPITEVIGIMKDVAKALAYAHQRGVVHRDIKPDNVLLSGGTAVVTDFGIAKAISAARSGVGTATLTQVGTSIGTPAYMAPEQAAGDPLVDHRADIYALGAMVYELCSGQSVFAGRTPQRMVAAHMGETPRPISELRGDMSVPLAELVMRCLEKEPEARPQSAADIVSVLETITSGSGMQAMPPLRGGPEMFGKALAIYAVAFVAVAMLAKAAIVEIGLPDWVLPGSLIVMALVLLVVLWTGYVQRVTRRTMAATPKYTPGGTPRREAHGTIATMALKAAPHVSWHKTALGGMYLIGAFAAIIAAFMAMRALGIGPPGSLFATGRLNSRDPILFTDFRTANADSSLGRVVSDAVRAGLSGSSAFTLVSPVAIVSALQRMKQAPTTRVDSAVAREIALREGIKAIVDGDVTGVPGGYIVSIRLVSADSGLELASFRESGDGPRGLIDAADKLARALRAKAGESLRSVNGTPPLSRATTSSLDALRKFSETRRLAAAGDARAVTRARETVALDSTFASGWAALGSALSDYGGTRSAIDSALAQAYRFRERLPVLERDRVTAIYYGKGPGRDRAKAVAAYEDILQRGDSAVLVSLAEVLRSRREYARAESLNLAAARRNPSSSVAIGNTVEMQLNQGKVREATATVARLRDVAAVYVASRQLFVWFAQGNVRVVRSTVDSLLRPGADPHARFDPGIPAARALALLDGRLRDDERLHREGGPSRGVHLPDDAIYDIGLELVVRGRSAPLSARLDAAIAQIPFRELPMVDRPYFAAATTLARAGSAEKARAMVGRYLAEVTDTSIRREQEPNLHDALGEIALANNKPRDALTEFRRGDVGYDGRPANECAPCLPFNLARAFDAAGTADSAAMMYERYLATPYWLKPAMYDLDPVRVPAIHERLGQLYEAMGNIDKAAEHDRAFIDLWKNSDTELQPRVTEARRRLLKLTPVEKPRQ